MVQYEENSVNVNFNLQEKCISSSKFNLYCLINYGKNEEAQLILDLKKELGFDDSYYENKINYLFGYFIILQISRPWIFTMDFFFEI